MDLLHYHKIINIYKMEQSQIDIRFSKFNVKNEFTCRKSAILKITVNATSKIKLIVPYYDNAQTKAFIGKTNVAPNLTEFCMLFDELKEKLSEYTEYGSGTNKEITLEQPGIYYVVGFVYQYTNTGGEYNVCEVQYLDDNSNGDKFIEQT